MTRYLGNIPHKPQIENKYLTKKQHRILRIKYPVAKLNIRPQVQLKESLFAVGSKYWISQMFAYEVRNIRRNYYIFHFFTLLKICSVPISYFVFQVHQREAIGQMCSAKSCSKMFCLYQSQLFDYREHLVQLFSHEFFYRTRPDNRFFTFLRAQETT